MSRDERQRGFDSASYLSDDLYRLNQIAINGTNQEYHHDPSGSRHSHIGLLYANQAEQFAGVIPLIRDGLNRGERCYYVYDDNTKADVVAAMREAGIDVKMATETGALSFHTPEELFLQEGVFDLETTIANTKETIREAIEDEGYDGIRMSGEMSWVLDREHSLDRMIKYEQTLNSLYENQPVIGICQYNVKRFDPEIINQLIRSHPNFVFGEEAARHFYYIPHEGVGSTVAPETINDDRSIYSFFERIQAYETLEQRERGLHALNEATQELMFLDGEEIAKRAPDIIRDMLGVSFASFYSYDEDSGDLKCRRSSIAAADGFNSGFSEQYLDRAWKVFVTETPDILDDLPPSTNSDGTETSPRSGVIVPLGRHGVFCTCSTHPNAFDNPTVNLAETVGANIEAALDRADRERTLQKKNEQLDRLNRINRVIREIDEALVEADTRAEIEQIVCERLTTFDPYQCIWIGDQDLTTETITPHAHAGDQNGFLESITLSTDTTSAKQGPVTTARQTRKVQVVQDVLTDPEFKPWRETALSHGFRACISIPLVYQKSVYGVLTLYTGSPNSFNELEKTVLTELGETIAHAIDAAETKQTLRTDSVTEVTLRIQESDNILTQLAHESQCETEFNFDGLVPQSDGSAHLFFTTHGVAPKDVLAGAKQVAGIAELQAIRDDEEQCVFEAIVTRPTLASHILENQGLIRSLTVTDTTINAVIDLPATTTVREFVETMQERYQSTELMTRRVHDRPIKSRHDLRNALTERFTERQREILETAYRSGFFESPRVRTGKELSETLDITQSTFSHHLREAQRRLCELVFENS